jgi:hypothetical protein
MSMDRYANYVIQAALGAGSVSQRNEIADDVIIIVEVSNFCCR